MEQTVDELNATTIKVAMAEMNKQKEIIAKFAVSAIAEKIAAIQQLIAEIKELQTASGIKVDVPWEIEDTLSDIHRAWKSSSDMC